jgi:hypothetical protein
MNAWRDRRKRLDPSAIRIVMSRRRAEARATSSVAQFPHASSSITPRITETATSGVKRRSRTPPCSASPLAID